MLKINKNKSLLKNSGSLRKSDIPTQRIATENPENKSVDKLLHERTILRKSISRQKTKNEQIKRESKKLVLAHANRINTVNCQISNLEKEYSKYGRTIKQITLEVTKLGL